MEHWWIGSEGKQKEGIASALLDVLDINFQLIDDERQHLLSTTATAFR